MRELRFVPIQLTGVVATVFLQIGALGCTPTLAIEAPKEPIVINMNIKVEHEIRMEVDRDLEAIIEEEGDIF